ncbi:MAG: pantoate--beta-alanine ligase [Nitrospira bacterium HGW-Nitrospira-1]|nr:MAG: pantoate--beta-alanine ligase [Nitrospira bacterium HGW-Nitrospira-1]
MELLRIPRITQDSCKKHLLRGRSLGFVPTMGALHAGHLSLIKRAKMENDVVIVSIFVNPLQFGPAEDLDKYPRDIEEDIRKLRQEDIDILFLPDNNLMYPQSFSTSIEVGALSERLYGKFRPGHFRGVATVVAKLFNIITPTRAYFGQKDFQQTVIIKKMAKDLNFDVDIIACPTMREHDGLAMSSRNVYLDKEQRRAACVLYRCLIKASDTVQSGVTSGKKIRELMKDIISSEPLIAGIDYASVYDPETLEEVDEIKNNVLFAVAVRIGKTRLIDNIFLIL